MALSFPWRNAGWSPQSWEPLDAKIARQPRPWQFGLATLMAMVTIFSLFLGFTMAVPTHISIEVTFCVVILSITLWLTIALYRGGVDGPVFAWIERLMNFTGRAHGIGILIVVGIGCALLVKAAVEAVWSLVIGAGL